MQQRLTQLIAKYLGVGLVYIAGWFSSTEFSTAQAESIAMPIATGVVAAGFLIYELLIHKRATGGILTPAGEKKLPD